MSTATAEKPQGTAVATIAPPRLPYHPAIEERYGVDRSQWKALVEAVFPLAKTPDAVVLALSYCKARRLDPFKRVVHIVPIYDTAAGRYVETVWPGIAEHRTTAFRTGQYAGADPCAYGPEEVLTFTGKPKDSAPERTVTLKVPRWAQLTLYRMIQSQRVPMPGPRVYFMETYSRIGRSELPNDRWQRAPMQMLEKCAEAAALRRAFPEELGDEMTIEEEGAVAANRATDVTPPTAPPAPTRAEFVEQPAEAPAETATHDPETGEVVEQAEPEPVAEKVTSAQLDPIAPVRAALALCKSAEDVDNAEADLAGLLEDMALINRQQARGLFMEAKQKMKRGR